ncbi:MAG: response regulator [Candidatus Omnitrophica bacterium]|nr:response regulator [Candidatus Omnitrophota bacterium]
MSGKILVVDDEMDFVKLIKVRLEREGFGVDMSHNGPDALKKVAAEKPVAVLLDIQMPGMDGLEVLEKIRKIDNDLPVFMLTASREPAYFERANQLRASGFIQKTSDLGQEIRRIVSSIRISKGFLGDKSQPPVELRGEMDG